MVNPPTKARSVAGLISPIVPTIQHTLRSCSSLPFGAEDITPIAPHKTRLSIIPAPGPTGAERSQSSSKASGARRSGWVKTARSMFSAWTRAGERQTRVGGGLYIIDAYVYGAPSGYIHMYMEA